MHLCTVIVLNKSVSKIGCGETNTVADGLSFISVIGISQMKEALTEIIQLATVDSEPWVLMVADILKTFPETGSLNLDLEEQNPNVQDILGELREKGQSYVVDQELVL